MPLQSGFQVGVHSRINSGTAADSSVQLATGPGEVVSFQAFNASSAQLLVLKLYDSSGGTASTTLVPLWRGIVPFSGSLSTGSLSDIPGGNGFVHDFSHGLPFNNGMLYAICTTLADTANTTAAASLAVINIQLQAASSNYTTANVRI